MVQWITFCSFWRWQFEKWCISQLKILLIHCHNSHMLLRGNKRNIFFCLAPPTKNIVCFLCSFKTSRRCEITKWTWTKLCQAGRTSWSCPALRAVWLFQSTDTEHLRREVKHWISIEPKKSYGGEWNTIQTRRSFGKARQWEHTRRYPHYDHFHGETHDNPMDFHRPTCKHVCIYIYICFHNILCLYVYVCAYVCVYIYIQSVCCTYSYVYI